MPKIFKKGKLNLYLIRGKNVSESLFSDKF